MEKSILDDMSLVHEDLIRVRTHRDILKSRVSILSDQESAARYMVDLRQKESEIFKKWLEDALERNVNSMAEVVTTALRHIIHDQELSFRVIQEAKYNRVAMRFLLEDKGPEGSVEGDPMASYGGGAAVVISLILRLAIMSRMGMANLLLLDESMVALANAYVPSAAQFLRQLAEETGVNIFMVTHNPEFIAYAHTAYEGTKDSCLHLKKLQTGASL